MIWTHNFKQFGRIRASLGRQWLGINTLIASHYVDHECDDVKELLTLVEERKKSAAWCPDVIVMKNDQTIEL